MYRGATLALVLAALCAAALCSCGRAAAPKFEGRVGHLEQEGGFSLFLEANEGKPVELDVWMAAADDIAGSGGKDEWFAVWEECEGLVKGEKPGMGKCTGTEYHIAAANGRKYLTREGPRWRLRGRFTPKPAGGPLQGLLTEILQAEE
ncbi:MAG: hypothetical protein ABI972_31555 [Acidobacteriota bacterium]